MTNNMKAKLSVILSLISMLGVISVWGLWLFESLELTVVSLDTFIGVIVALLAIIVTVAIGYQIINTIEVKDEIIQLRKTQRLIVENEQNVARLANNLQADSSSTTSQLYAAKGEYFEAFVFFHSAFYFAIEAEASNQMGYIDQLNNLLEAIERLPVTDYFRAKQEIKSYSEKIRATKSYRNCFGQEYEKVLQKFEDKMKQLGLENGQETKQ